MEWISVEDEIPHDDEIVLVCDEISGIVTLAKFIMLEERISLDLDDADLFHVMYITELDNDYCVTHWMRRPTPPIYHIVDANDM